MMPSAMVNSRDSSSPHELPGHLSPVIINPVPDTVKIMLGQKSCRTKVLRIFRIFLPDFLLRIFLEFFEDFLWSLFPRKRRPQKFTKNPRHFSMPKPQANTKKIFTKVFWRGGTPEKLGSEDWARGSGGVAGTSPKTFSRSKNSSKQEIWSSQFFRDLSQFVRRTPRDTPVPLYTRTSPWPRGDSKKERKTWQICSQNAENAADWL